MRRVIPDWLEDENYYYSNFAINVECDATCILESTDIVFAVNCEVSVVANLFMMRIAKAIYNKKPEISILVIDNTNNEEKQTDVEILASLGIKA